MLIISDLSVAINEQSILDNLSLTIEPGSIHAIMGPNGSGKSTLSYTLAGHPAYCITNGQVTFNGEDITHISPDKRARLGLFLVFQQPQSIPGVRVLTFLHESYRAVRDQTISVADFQKVVVGYMEQLQIDQSFLFRNLNDGFSGGEKKRFELLQLMLLKPKLAILDEIDSGLDIDAIKVVTNGLRAAQKNDPELSILIITHYRRILQYIAPHRVHVLCNGMITKSGDMHIVDTLEQGGYDAYKKSTEHTL